MCVCAAAGCARSSGGSVASRPPSSPSSRASAPMSCQADRPRCHHPNPKSNPNPNPAARPTAQGALPGLPLHD
eukprot:4429903-Prymnesium_polylepis.1